MSAEAAGFEVLRNTLEIKGFHDFERKGFNRPNEDFWRMCDLEKVPKHCDCCEPSLKGCSSVTGFNCAVLRHNEEVVDDIHRLIHFYKIHKNIEEEGKIFPLNKECLNILKKYVKIENEPCEGMVFYTIVPRERLPYNDFEIMKLTKFCEGIFTAKNFTKCAWVIESGKHEDCPNLHIHALGKLKNKNFKRMFMTRWHKQYDIEYNIKYEEGENKGWHMVPCNTLKIQSDKINYLNNVLKGSHENFVDLKIGNKFGF